MVPEFELLDFMLVLLLNQSQLGLKGLSLALVGTRRRRFQPFEARLRDKFVFHVFAR
jgi:hypothetical protein